MNIFVAGALAHKELGLYNALKKSHFRLGGKQNKKKVDAIDCLLVA